MGEPKLDIDKRCDRIEKAILAMACWPVLGAQDPGEIKRILYGEDESITPITTEGE